MCLNTFTARSCILIAMASASFVRTDRLPVLGYLAIMGSVIGMLLWPFLGATWFLDEQNLAEQPATARAWAEPLLAHDAGLLSWSDPHTMYMTYGKVSILMFVGFIAGLVGLHARQKERAGRVGLWGYRVALASSTVFLAGLLVAYTTPLTDVAFMTMMVPGLLGQLVGYPLFGWGAWRARVAPRLVAGLLLVGAFPLFIPLSVLLGHNSAGFLVLCVAWLAVGVRLVRDGRAARAATPASSQA